MVQKKIKRKKERKVDRNLVRKTGSGFNMSAFLSVFGSE